MRMERGEEDRALDLPAPSSLPLGDNTSELLRLVPQPLQVTTGEGRSFPCAIQPVSQYRAFSLSVRSSQGAPRPMVVVATAAGISDHRQSMNPQYCHSGQKGEHETEDTGPSRAAMEHKP